MPHFQIDLISNEECKKKLRGILKIHPTHLCGFKPGTNLFSFFLLESDECSSGVDACQGDSGGPASILKNGRQTQVKKNLRKMVGKDSWDGPLQIGIVSLGKGCGDPRFPGLYTRVTSILSWIKNVTDGYKVWNDNCQLI